MYMNNTTDFFFEVFVENLKIICPDLFLQYATFSMLLKESEL